MRRKYAAHPGPTFSEISQAASFSSSKGNPISRKAAIIKKMSGAIASAVKIPEVKKRYEDLLVETVGSSPQELDHFLDEQLAINNDIIGKSKIELQG